MKTGEGELKEEDRVKIISDIDDTIFPSLYDHSGVSGKIYPGLRELYMKIDPHGYNTIFISARPKILASMTYKKLQKFGFPTPVVLTGTLRTALSNSGMSKKKFENYRKFKQLYPEYKFILFGDSGQGDIQFGQMVLSSPNGRDENTVFIHDILTKKGRKTSPAQRSVYRENGVTLHDGYTDHSAFIIP